MKNVSTVRKVLISIVYVLCFFAIMFAMCYGSVAAYGSPNKIIKLSPHNTIGLRGFMDEGMVAKVMDEIAKNENDTIYLVIDSPGGSVDDGLKMIDAMRSSGKKFVCVTTGAASMAFSVLQACDVRYITEHAILMQHIGSYVVSGSANKNKSFVDYTDKQFSELLETDGKRLGLNKDQFYNLVKDDFWISGTDAVKANAADEIVGAVCTKDLSEQRVVDKYYLVYSEVTIVKAGCPLISAAVSVTIESKTGANAAQVEVELNKNNFDRKFKPNSYFGKRSRDSP